MRRVLVVSAVIAITLPLLAQSPAPADAQNRDEPPLPQRLGGMPRFAPVPTDPVPRLPDGTVDLSGAWVGGGPVGDLAAGLKPGQEIRLLPWAKELMEARRLTPERDPHSYCMPMGVPRQAGSFPWRFVQWPTHKAATHLWVLFEGNNHHFRQIFMDGRKHPANPDPTWFGHSIGRWEGDTLVIDSVGFNDKFWFDRRGHPHTERLHIIERWKRDNFGTLVNDVTIDDPGAYAAPFTLTFTAKLRHGDELMEYICTENNQFGAAGGYSNPYAAAP